MQEVTMQLAEEALAISEGIVFGEELAMDDIPDKEVLDKINSVASASLKLKWVMLVNSRQALLDQKEIFRAEKYNYLSVSPDDAHSKDFEDTYAIVRDKICEITAIRALARPVPEGETRCTLCEKASETITQLDGNLDAKLGMKLQKAQNK